MSGGGEPASSAYSNHPEFDLLSALRQHVLITLIFNWGIYRLLRFERRLAAIESMILRGDDRDA